MNDISETIQQQIVSAYQDGQALRIAGGNSKSFYGNTVSGETLNVVEHRGITSYAATELVITARGGTPLQEIKAELAAQRQMLAFEPPQFSDTATLGGTIACNFSGPRRAYAGAARDFVLGCKIINGKGEMLSFGGEVMKNVAGYDVSRLMAGAMGTLGVITEVSLKVLPLPEQEITLAHECDDKTALEHMHRWSRLPLPISATCYDGDRLFVRISAGDKAVAAARKHIGGEEVPAGKGYWKKIREQQHAFFNSDTPLWRMSVESDAAAMHIDGKCLYEWGGAQRWVKSEASAGTIRKLASAANGHAVLFRKTSKVSTETVDVFHPLSDGLQRIHKNLKIAFDPAGILNPGKMYVDI